MPDRFGTMTKHEVVTIVAQLFANGMPPEVIVATMKSKYGIEISRQAPLRMLKYVAQRGWLIVRPPPDMGLARQLTQKYGGSAELEVVSTGTFEHVADRGAEMLMNQLVQLKTHNGKEEVHVGLAGGYVVRETCRAFSHYLRESPERLPRTIVFHAMVGGMDVDDPDVNPSTFVEFFRDKYAGGVNVEFVCLNTPAFVTNQMHRELRNAPGIAEAFARGDALDIVLTSASANDGHSPLDEHLARHPDCLQKLKAAGYEVDLLWRPLGINGPIDIETDWRAMTLKELSDLHRLVNRGGAVLLLLGPCAKCGKTKEKVLRTILRQPKNRRLVTHVVVDSRTARALLTWPDDRNAA